MDIERKVLQTSGERVKECRQRAKITQKELAKLSFVSKQHVYFIEKNKRSLTEQMAVTFSNILHVDPDYLLCRTDYETTERRASDIFGAYDDQKELCNIFFKSWLDLNGYKCNRTVVKPRKEIESADGNMARPLMSVNGWCNDNVTYEVISYIFSNNSSSDVGIPIALPGELELTNKDFSLFPFEILDYVEMRMRQITDYNKTIGRTNNRYMLDAIQKFEDNTN